MIILLGAVAVIGIVAVIVLSIIDVDDEWSDNRRPKE